DMHQDTDTYYWKARKVLATEDQANEAFVRLVGGGGSAADEFFRCREGIGAAAECLVEAAEAGFDTPRIMDTGERLHLRERFVESSQLMAQARLGDGRQLETPLRREGLVPSRGGLRWAVPPV